VFDPLGADRKGLALAVVLDPGGPQTGKAMFIEGSLPVQEFINAERVALACFFKAKQSTANGGNNFGLPTNNPATGICRGEIGYRKRTTIRADNVLNAWTHLYGHFTLYST
jgi:hypothetical protein